MTAHYDRDKAQREASRDRESLDLTDWWAYLVVGAVGLILGALILDLILGIDMHVVLSGGILAALAVGIFWFLRRILKPQ
ncbi:MAG: hypothetical protein DME00_36220 [Candidatus Rokuibacteriota bacterium]|nr:MAG: hypothetical protein DME00_36220 [Candidatus Rokubacteria bacterium]